MGAAIYPQVKCGGGQNYECVYPCSFPPLTFEDFKENTEIFVSQHDVDENQV